MLNYKMQGWNRLEGTRKFLAPSHSQSGGLLNLGSELTDTRDRVNSRCTVVDATVLFFIAKSTGVFSGFCNEDQRCIINVGSKREAVLERISATETMITKPSEQKNRAQTKRLNSTTPLLTHPNTWCPHRVSFCIAGLQWREIRPTSDALFFPLAGSAECCFCLRRVYGVLFATSHDSRRFGINWTCGRRDPETPLRLDLQVCFEENDGVILLKESLSTAKPWVANELSCGVSHYRMSNFLDSRLLTGITARVFQLYITTRKPLPLANCHFCITELRACTD